MRKVSKMMHMAHARLPWLLAWFAGWLSEEVSQGSRGCHVKRVVSSAGQALVGYLALLLFTSLLLIVGCGAQEESQAPEEDEQPTTAPSETTQRATTKEASTLSPYEVIQAFENAGLEVGEIDPVEQEPGWDENRVPKTYAQAARFTIPSLGVPEEGVVSGPRDRGGRVFVFDSQRDLDAVRGYYEALGPSALPHVYVKDPVLLLQITNDLPKAEADRYGAVLQEAA